MIDLECIRAASRIADLVAERFTVRPRGRHFTTQEHDSLVLFPETGSYAWYSKDEYGDVFDFVGRYHLGYGSGWNNHDPVQFREAVEHLAGRAGIPIARGTDFRQTAAWAERQLVQRLHDALLNTPPALSYATHARGWEMETIRLAKLGCMPSDKRRLLEGLNLPDHWRSVIERFPAGMLVYIHQHKGRLTYLSGRSIEGKQHYNPPRELIGAKQPYFNHCYTDDAGQVVVVEGQADAIALAQLDVAAVALCGTDASDSLLDQLRQHRRVFILLDNEAGTASKARKLAERLPMQACLPMLPIPGDPNEWLLSGATADDAGAMLNSAQHWLDAEIARVAALDGLAREDALDALLETVAAAGLDARALDRFGDRLCEALKEMTRSRFNRWRKGLGAASQIETTSELTILEDDVPLISPAQAFIGGEALVTVALRMVDHEAGQHALVPHLVTGARTIQRLDFDAGLIQPNGHLLALRTPPSAHDLNARWVYSDIRRFLDGETPDPAETYSQIRGLLAARVDFVEPEHADLLTLWTIGTYCYTLFPAYPYLSLQGPKGSGKTTVLSLLGPLAFNMITTASISPAALFRLIHETGCTVGIDEAESFTRSRDPMTQAVRQLLNSGYKADAPVYRTVGEEHRPQAFAIYAPKIICGINGLEDVLASRCLKIPMRRTRRQRPERPDSAAYAALRHALYSFALTAHGTIRQHAADSTIGADYFNRTRELWLPLLALARTFEAAGVDGLTAVVHRCAAADLTVAENQTLDEDATAVLAAFERLTRTAEPESLTEIRASEVRAEAERLLERTDRDPQWVGHVVKRLPGLVATVPGRAGRIYRVRRATVLDLMAAYDVAAVNG